MDGCPTTIGTQLPLPIPKALQPRVLDRLVANISTLASVYHQVPAKIGYGPMGFSLGILEHLGTLLVKIIDVHRCSNLPIG